MINRRRIPPREMQEKKGLVTFRMLKGEKKPSRLMPLSKRNPVQNDPADIRTYLSRRRDDYGK